MQTRTKTRKRNNDKYLNKDKHGGDRGNEGGNTKKVN